MSSFRHPVGPEAPRVYWRRRAAVIGVLLLIVVVVVLIVVGRGSGAAGGTGQGQRQNRERFHRHLYGCRMRHVRAGSAADDGQPSFMDGPPVR